MLGGGNDKGVHKAVEGRTSSGEHPGGPGHVAANRGSTEWEDVVASRGITEGGGRGVLQLVRGATRSGPGGVAVGWGDHQGGGGKGCSY